MEAVVKFNYIDDCAGCRRKIKQCLKAALKVKDIKINDDYKIDAENNKVTICRKLDDLDCQLRLIQKFKKEFPSKKLELIVNNNGQNNNNSNGNNNGNGSGNGNSNSNCNGNGNGGEESKKGKEKVHGSNGSKRGGGDIASSSGSGNGSGGGVSENQPPQMDMMSCWDPWMGHYPQPMMNSGDYQRMRQDMDVYESIPTYRGSPPPVPPPVTFYSNPPHTIFSDDNANGCSIM